MAERRRLVLTSHTFLPIVGGAELGLHELAKRLGRRHEVIVLAPGDADPVIDYAPDGYRVIRVTRPARRAARKRMAARLAEFTGWAYARALIGLHRTGPPVDALGCHFLKRNGLITVLGRLLGIRVVVSLVGRSDVMASLGIGGRLRAAAILHLADEIVANSGYYLRGCSGAERARIIPYGVDLPAFAARRDRRDARAELGLGDGDFVLIAVQRLEPIKRVDLLLRVLAELMRVLPEVRLVVVGTGSQTPALTRLARELGLGASAVFTGYVPERELPALYGLSDAYVTHSESETFGMTFAEAMAAGLPIVAADTSCVRDVLTGDVATIVEAGDVPGFAAAIVELARDPKRAGGQGARGRSRAEREFDWDVIAGRYEQLLTGSGAGVGAARHGPGD